MYPNTDRSANLHLPNLSLSTVPCILDILTTPRTHDQQDQRDKIEFEAFSNSK